MMQSTVANTTSSNTTAMFVGPYRLEKTLGKGQTGLVKLGIHHKTGKKVAIKIVNREKLSESVLMKVEREITIMKLIEHPHVLRLYDVYENKKYLYLILEHVSGGELFDYLIKKSRLTIKEARKFFKQIISALDFCHSHLICHRDLKPENLLLDDKLNIKIADFGMASLQVEGSMLETSCGSPHYACPEVIKGEKYDGRKADIWSCGVILYALIVGALPFDDENLKQLLEKIKKGYFQIPAYVPNDCQDLLRSMIQVDPNKRITIEGIYKHHWVLAGSNKDDLELELPLCQITPTAIIPSINDIDTDILSHMTTLGSFKDKQKLIENLLNDKHNTEKVIYFLLLDRKLKQPTKEDEDDLVSLRFRSIDAPRKRIDRFKIPYDVLYSKLTVGSPNINRRSNVLIGQQARYQSCHTTPIGSPCTSPMIMNKDIKMHNFNNTTLITDTPPPVHRGPLNLSSCNTPADSLSINSQVVPTNTIRSRINSLKKNIQLPKFSRRKVTPEKVTNDLHTSTNTMLSKTPDAQSATKSWFQRWSSASSSQNGSVLSVDKEREKELVFTISDRPLSSIKALLVHSFLSIKNLLHSLNTTNSFACDYRLSERNALSCVRFMVDIQIDSTAILKQIESKQQSQYPTYKIVFQFISGSQNEFKNLFTQIYQFIAKNRYNTPQRKPSELITQTLPYNSSTESTGSSNGSTNVAITPTATTSYKTVMTIPVASQPIAITNSPQLNKVLQKVECSPNKSNFINYSTLYTTNLH